MTLHSFVAKIPLYHAECLSLPSLLPPPRSLTIELCYAVDGPAGEGQDGEGHKVPQTGRDGSGNVVRVDPKAMRANDDGDHEEAEHSAGRAGSDQGRSREDQSVGEAEGPVCHPIQQQG